MNKDKLIGPEIALLLANALEGLLEDAGDAFVMGSARSRLEDDHELRRVYSNGLATRINAARALLKVYRAISETQENKHD